MIKRWIAGLTAICLMNISLANPCRAQDVVVPLSVIKGTDRQPYLQVYTVPVQCGDVKADFTWGCYGITQISESFAKKCKVTITPSAELGDEFVGKGNLPVQFGGVQYSVEANIIKDSQAQESEKSGVIGIDISKNRQWTLDPEKQTLTLRDNGSDPPTKPLAELDLGNEGAGLSLKVKVRNDVEDVGLMPGSSYVQAAPDLQSKWDLGGMLEQAKEAPKAFGNVRMMTLHGNDAMEVTPQIIEHEVTIALVGDPKHPELTDFAQSGLGQSLLNRWVYTVDESTRKFYILRRVPPGKATPSTAPSNSATGDQDTLRDFLKENKK